MTSRRQFLGGLAAAGGTLVLGGCGSPDERVAVALDAGELPPFEWGIGLENTWMMQADPDKDGLRLPLDEYQLTQHYDRWKDDHALIADLGVTSIRYSLPWPKAEATQGTYDWSWLDVALDHLVNTLHIVPTLDLVHYGAPAWMADGIADDRFPDALASYAAATADHFRGLVTRYTPHNEPGESAWSCGWAGLWPPYAKTPETWAALGVRIARAMVLASQSLRATLADATLISAEAVSPSLADKLFKDQPVDDDLRMTVGCFPACLAYGKVGMDDLFARYLMGLGVARADLEWLVANAAPPDVIGLNHYPDLGDFPGARDFTQGGAVPLEDAARQAVDRTEQALRRAHDYFARPICLSETSAGIAPEARAAYATALGGMVARLRADGFPLVGVNWWPLIEAAAWGYRDMPRQPLTKSLVAGAWNNALYDLQPFSDGRLERVETVAVKAYREVVRS